MFHRERDWQGCVFSRHLDWKATCTNTKVHDPETIGAPVPMPGKGSVTRSVRIEKDAGRRLRPLAIHGGTGWSMFYEETIKTAFHDLLQREVRVESSDNQVVVRFRLFGDGERVKYRPR